MGFIDGIGVIRADYDLNGTPDNLSFDQFQAIAGPIRLGVNVDMRPGPVETVDMTNVVNIEQRLASLTENGESLRRLARHEHLGTLFRRPVEELEGSIAELRDALHALVAQESGATVVTSRAQVGDIIQSRRFAYGAKVDGSRSVFIVNHPLFGGVNDVDPSRARFEYVVIGAGPHRSDKVGDSNHFVRAISLGPNREWNPDGIEVGFEQLGGGSFFQGQYTVNLVRLTGRMKLEPQQILRGV